MVEVKVFNLTVEQAKIISSAYDYVIVKRCQTVPKNELLLNNRLKRFVNGKLRVFGLNQNEGLLAYCILNYHKTITTEQRSSYDKLLQWKLIRDIDDFISVKVP